MSGLRREKEGIGCLEDKFNKGLFIICMTTFMIMLISQGVLINQTLRSKINHAAIYDGLPLQDREVLYHEGSITLTIDRLDGNEKIKVLVNGDVVQNFYSNSIDIKLKDGDVVEVDASDVSETIPIIITAISQNIKNAQVGQRIEIHSELRKIIKVRISS